MVFYLMRRAEKGTRSGGYTFIRCGTGYLCRWLLGWLQKVRFTCGWILVVVCSCTGSGDIEGLEER